MTTEMTAAAKADRVETITVRGSEDGMRLDRWFRVHFPEVAYAYLQKLLRSGQVRVDGKRAQANDRLNAGAELRVPKIAREPVARIVSFEVSVRSPLG